MPLDIWPAKTTFATGEPIALVATTPEPVDAQVRVTHLGRLEAELTVEVPRGRSNVHLDPAPPGGYHVEFHSGAASAATAFDVLEHPMRRPRYGFVSDFPEGRDDLDAVADTLRQLHLNVIQFYDWMYRHHDLLPPDESYTDLLGRNLSRSTVERLIDTVRNVGALPVAYGAVYGAGFDYADQHPDQRLRRRDGTPHSLGDLLAIMNIAPDSPWTAHVIGEFARAIDELGFAGIHLDQYGDPKRALDADGTLVDLEEVFPPFIARTRQRLPDATLIFNNVNDYPTWTTVDAPQDATYIEVWPPHDTYADLAALVTKARHLDPDRPVILAAYLEPFADNEQEPRSAAAARLALATVFSHGGHYLLCGEHDGVLTHPYYPNYATVGDRTMEAVRECFDLAVALGDVLYDPRSVDITKSVFAGINHDIQLDAADTVTPDPRPGALWLTVQSTPDWTTVHVIDLTAQSDIDWNTPKNEPSERTGMSLRVLEPAATGDWLLAAPGAAPQLVSPERDGDHLTVELPPFQGWLVAAKPTWVNS